jgi:hypothetical protein
LSKHFKGIPLNYFPSSLLFAVCGASFGIHFIRGFILLLSLET